MASSLGPKVGADFTMESVSEASIPGLELSDSKESYGAEGASTTKGAKSIIKLDKSTMTDKSLMSIGSSNSQASDPGIRAGEPNQVLATGSSKRGIEFALVVELASDTDNEEELGPHFLIDVTEEIGKKIIVMVIVSMVAPFSERANRLIHTGDFMLEVNQTTTIRKIKFGITRSLDICYEDMALVYSGKFLSDARSVEYYFIDNGHTLHLIVEPPNQLFKEVFAAFTSYGLVEKKAWYATRSIIHVMHTKYHVGDIDEAPAITEEELLYELEQLQIPDTDDSDDSSADEDGDDSSDDDDENSEDDVSDCDEDESEEDEDWDINEDGEWEIDEDTANELAELMDYIATHVQIVAHSSHVEVYKWN